MAAWIPLVAGAASLLGSIFSSRQSRKNTKSQIAYQKAEAERERASNMEMWNTQTAYNSPKEQMARLQSAGLNPNLAYGSGNVAGLSADTPKGYQRAGNVDFHQQQSVLGNAMQTAPAVLSMYQDYKMKDAQIGIAQQENWWRGIMLNEKQILTAEQARLARAKGVDVSLRAPYVAELAKYTLEGKKAQIEKVRQDTRALKLENQLNAMLKPYGLTSRDNAAIRQIVRVMSEDNPDISAIDVMLLLPTLLPGIGSAGRAIMPYRKIRPVTKTIKR
ncbi:MAG: hypothetical protein QW260_08330 [Thermoproteota archaeon]